MKVTINSDVAQQHGMTTQEVMLVSSIKSGLDVEQSLADLVKRQVLIKDLFGGYSVTQRWAEVCDDVLLSSDSSIPTDSELSSLADKMMELMPQGRKEGTSYYFKCNKREIVLKLKKFTKLYGKYSDADILAATKKYVDSFNGDYSYMRLLKYFILKEDRKTDAEGNGYVEESSTLATLLESKGATGIPKLNFDSGEIV